MARRRPSRTGKGACNWSVRSVFNDPLCWRDHRAGLQSVPETPSPASAKFQAIIRSGGRWVVATSKGVITARKRVPYPEASADEW